MTRTHLLAAALLCLGAVPFAHAGALFIVTKTADTADGSCDDDCSLREAVQAANALPGPDQIRLRHAYYALSITSSAQGESYAGDLDVTDDVTIRGLADRSTIDANGIDRVIEIPAGVTAELIDLTLKEGRASREGGCVRTEGALTLRRVWVQQCSLFLDIGGVLRGAGIYNLGVLRLVSARVRDNVALEGLTGGMGGGIFNGPGAQLYMYDTDVRFNVTGLDDAPGQGAGLFNWGQARIDRSFFGWNDPGGGEGSAMANRHGASLAVFNTTVSGNGHDGAQGAIANGSANPDVHESASKLKLHNATIANNNGGGVLNAGRATVWNTIIAGNYTQDVHDRWYDAGKNCVNLDGATMNQSASLIGADGNCPGDISVDNATVFSVVLEHLRYLGGPTPVHNLRPGPYAIDMGRNDLCPAWDQRRGRRPADGDMNDSEICDIGAMEVGADE